MDVPWPVLRVVQLNRFPIFKALKCNRRTRLSENQLEGELGVSLIVERNFHLWKGVIVG